jgi:phosphoglucosamine mutase
MRKNGCNVGGEQSGHIILSDFARTGDGLVAALQVLAVLVGSKKPASQVCRVFEQTPQKLKSVRFQNGDPMMSLLVAKAIKEMEADLGKTGRVLVRKSGTEPLVRIMVESESAAKLDKVIAYILDAMDQEDFIEKSA